MLLPIIFFSPTLSLHGSYLFRLSALLFFAPFVSAREDMYPDTILICQWDRKAQGIFVFLVSIIISISISIPSVLFLEVYGCN
jgi:hypothetical protein